MRVRAKTHAALLAAGLALALAWPALVLTHSPPKVAVPESVALRHALRDPAVGRVLGALHWTHVAVIPLDARVETLAFDRGARLVATVDIGTKGPGIVVLDTQELTHQRYVNGSGIAHEPRVLALLVAVFVLMTGVWPVWRLRNLDVLVMIGSVGAIVLQDHWLVTAMVRTSYPALFYLAIRCTLYALAPRPARPATPLFEHLTGGWTDLQRLRLLRLGALAAALIVVMVGFTSLHPLDVVIAAMEGATAVVHGLLPYGHIPDVFHGDTYPIASYLLYVPLAALSPVNNQWDSVDLALLAAAFAAPVAAWGLRRIFISGVLASVALPGSEPASTVARRAEREIAGLRAAIAFLTFPPLLVAASTGTSDVALAAMLVGALVLWRRPGASVFLLSLGAWFKLSPVALLPIWLARLRGRYLRRALRAVVLTSLVMLIVLVVLGGLDGPGRMLSAMSFQLTRQAPTLWQQIGSVPLQQLVQAATLALLAGSVVRLRGDRALAQDHRRLAALSAAILLALQISGNYWSYLYLVWILPFLALSVLGPGEHRSAPCK